MKYEEKLKKAIKLGMTPPTSSMSYECCKIWADIVDAIDLRKK